MSMNAMFVQVDEAELSGIQADPSLAETLFASEPLMPPVFTALAKAMQDRVRAAGPQLMADALSRLDPALRRQIEESMVRTTTALAGGGGGDAILKLMEGRRARGAGAHTVLSLDKAWHGVHYVLCGEVEPGPPRYFTAAQVAEVSQALSRPDLESQAAARFDAARMSQLKIYPGWRPSDAEWVIDSFRRLRDFYSDAAGKGRAMVTCLV